MDELDDPAPPLPNEVYEAEAVEDAEPEAVLGDEVTELDSDHPKNEEHGERTLCLTHPDVDMPDSQPISSCGGMTPACVMVDPNQLETLAFDVLGAEPCFKEEEIPLTQPEVIDSDLLANLEAEIAELEAALGKDEPIAETPEENQGLNEQEIPLTQPQVADSDLLANLEAEILELEAGLGKDEPVAETPEEIQGLNELTEIDAEIKRLEFFVRTEISSLSIFDLNKSY